MGGVTVGANEVLRECQRDTLKFAPLAVDPNKLISTSRPVAECRCRLRILFCRRVGSWRHGGRHCRWLDWQSGSPVAGHGDVRARGTDLVDLVIVGLLQGSISVLNGIPVAEAHWFARNLLLKAQG